MNRNVELDRLRGVAILLTLMIHYMRVFFPWSDNLVYHHSKSISNIWANCWSGVDLFFVISGYIISKKLIESLNCSHWESSGIINTVKDFYMNRFFRIYPVCIAVILFVLMASLFFNRFGYFVTPLNTIEAGISILTSTFNYYYIDGFYHGIPLSQYWSLSIEEQFYWIYPFFLIIFKSTKTRVLILLSLLIAITFIIRPQSSFQAIYLGTHTRSDGLLYGCLLYFISTQSWYKDLTPKLLSNRRVAMIFVATLVVILGALPGLGLSDCIVIPEVGIVSTILVFFASLEKKIIIAPKIFQIFLDYLGKRSYSMYLIHLPMLSLTNELWAFLGKTYGFKIGPELTLAYSLTALVLIVFSTEILFRCIEIPFMRFGKKILYQDNDNVMNDNNTFNIKKSVYVN